MKSKFIASKDKYFCVANDREGWETVRRICWICGQYKECTNELCRGGNPRKLYSIHFKIHFWGKVPSFGELKSYRMLK